jgi:hypothetical protein
MCGFCCVSFRSTSARSGTGGGHEPHRSESHAISKHSLGVGRSGSERRLLQVALPRVAWQALARRRRFNLAVGLCPPHDLGLRMLGLACLWGCCADLPPAGAGLVSWRMFFRPRWGDDEQEGPRVCSCHHRWHYGLAPSDFLSLTLTMHSEPSTLIPMVFCALVLARRPQRRRSLPPQWSLPRRLSPVPVSRGWKDAAATPPQHQHS